MDAEALGCAADIAAEDEANLHGYGDWISHILEVYLTQTTFVRLTGFTPVDRLFSLRGRSTFF